MTRKEAHDRLMAAKRAVEVKEAQLRAAGLENDEELLELKKERERAQIAWTDCALSSFNIPVHPGYYHGVR